MKLSEKIVIGLMMGTSMDGVDVALVRITPKNTHCLKFEIPELDVVCLDSVLFPIPGKLEIKLKKLISEKHTTLEDICKLNFIIGDLLCQASQYIIEKNKYDISHIDLIGSHGQTIYHIPQNITEDLFSIKSTLQIGEPSIIAEKTGITTIADFRPRDIAAGGEGAPLICFADVVLFKNVNKNLLIQNIGGISNVTALPINKEAFAFDNGPGNALIDIIAKNYFDINYDKGGEIGFLGQVNEDWIDKVIEDECYFHKKPPKTTGKELFNQEFINNVLGKYPLEDPKDIMTNFTSLTAKVIALSYKNFVEPKMDIDNVVLGGGGAYNDFLIHQLKKYTSSKITINTHEDFNISNKFKEAIGFAILAYTTHFGIYNNIPSCTGAKKQVCLGKIIPGD